MLGATRFRTRIEQFALPLRDVFAAFFFLNFGLALDPSTFGPVITPVIVAVVVTLVINTLGGQLIAWINKLTPAEGFNASAMLQTRGEFVLILATLAAGAGLDPRLTPFAGLYVLVMAVIGPVLAANSERAGAVLFRKRRRKKPDEQRDAMSEENFALVEAATSGQEAVPFGETEVDTLEPEDTPEVAEAADRLIEQAMSQSDEQTERKRDPEY